MNEIANASTNFFSVIALNVFRIGNSGTGIGVLGVKI